MFMDGTKCGNYSFKTALHFHSGHRIFFLVAIHIIILFNTFPIKIHFTQGAPHAFRDTNPEQGRKPAAF